MLDIHVEGDGEFSICRPAGEIDSYTVDSFREALADLVSVSQLLIDLSEVPFMDSAGLGALIGAIRKASENDGVVVVSCGRASLMGLLRTTGFDQIVKVTETIEEAMEALGRTEQE